MKVEKYSVVIGNVPSDTVVGEGSVVVGATDSHGNTMLTTPMTVGYSARGGAGDIVVGAFAGGGGAQSLAVQELRRALQEFAGFVVQRNEEALKGVFERLATEIRNPRADRGAVMMAWNGVKALATVGGAHALVAKVSAALLVLYTG